MRYKIGDVARTLGLTPAGLHFFEKEGVIEHGKGDDKHRFYDMPDIIRMVSYKKYRAMDYPMKDILHQFSPQGENLSGIISRMDHRIADLEAKLNWYRNCIQDTRWYHERLIRGKDRLGVIDLQRFSGGYVLSVGEQGMIGKHKAEQETMRLWLDEMPATHLSCVDTPNHRVLWAMGVDLKRGQELGLDRLPGVEYLPDGLALHTFCSVPSDFFSDPGAIFNSLKQQAARRNFKQCGRAVCAVICVVCANDRRDSLCECWLPIS